MISRLEELTVYPAGYAEPGYGNDGRKCTFVITGNWNSITIPQTDNMAEFEDQTLPELCHKFSMGGVRTEWSDEWTPCDACGRLVRTSPDGYGWRPYYATVGIDTVCAECIKSRPTRTREYLAELEGNSAHCIPFELPLEKLGYIKINDEPLEHGLHGGQCDDPKIIAENMTAPRMWLNVRRFVFMLDSTGQFDIRFSVWVHKDDFKVGTRFSPVLAERFKRMFNSTPAYRQAKIDPADALKAALQDATAKMGRLPDGQGIKHAQLNADGTATVRLVSPAEFINGIGRKQG